jgi:hypothetical protein
MKNKKYVIFNYSIKMKLITNQRMCKILHCFTIFTHSYFFSPFFHLLYSGTLCELEKSECKCL